MPHNYFWRVSEVVITRWSWKPFEGNLTRVRIPYPPSQKACKSNDLRAFQFYARKFIWKWLTPVLPYAVQKYKYLAFERCYYESGVFFNIFQLFAVGSCYYAVTMATRDFSVMFTQGCGRRWSATTTKGLRVRPIIIPIKRYKGFTWGDERNAVALLCYVENLVPGCLFWRGTSQNRLVVATPRLCLSVFSMNIYIYYFLVSVHA